MNIFAGESSDEEYFPTTEELEDDEEAEEEDEEEEDDDDDEDEDEEYYEDEEDTTDFELQTTTEEDRDHFVEDDEEAVERILLQSNPGFLRQIQQVLQHGIGIRSGGASGIYDDEPPPRRRRRALDLPPLPYVAGKRLLNSGEFGPLDDTRVKRRRYEAPRTLTQFARFRELGWRRENPVFISRKWIPAGTKGSLVAQYDRHVYSGQFSHDGSFFYTASQDFRCRMYSTLNPANSKDWKLYKVFFTRKCVDVDCPWRNRTMDNYGCDVIS